MSADFWAGYISGAVGIIIGNPLDVLKVKLQAGVSSSRSTTSSSIPSTLGTSSSSSHGLPTSQQPTPAAATRTAAAYLRPWITGTAAPVIGYGALNALLFVSYNRTESALNHAFNPLSTSASSTTGTNLYTTFLAGAVGGLATWVVSTPTELIKCRVQLASSSSPSPSSWSVTKRVLQTQGIKGLYFGGLVTALRDSIGYGFYFWSYELTSRWMAQNRQGDSQASAASVLLCGGLAGIVTWASIFPLDVIKTRVQTQVMGLSLPVVSAVNGIINQREPLLPSNNQTNTANTPKAMSKPLGAWEIARQMYNQGGIKPFFRGLGVCSVRAFIVNAGQWAVYEWIMTEMGVGRNRGANGEIPFPPPGGVEGRVL